MVGAEKCTGISYLWAWNWIGAYDTIRTCTAEDIYKKRRTQLNKKIDHFKAIAIDERGFFLPPAQSGSEKEACSAATRRLKRSLWLWTTIHHSSALHLKAFFLTSSSSSIAPSYPIPSRLPDRIESNAPPTATTRNSEHVTYLYRGESRNRWCLRN